MSTLQVRNVVSPDGGISDNLLPVTASAWVNFNGTGVVTIRDSYNVLSVTDNGTGDYTVNLANTLNTANYTIISTVGGIGDGYLVRTVDDLTPRTLNLFRLGCATGTTAVNIDMPNVDVVVLGGQ